MPPLKGIIYIDQDLKCNSCGRTCGHIRTVKGTKIQEFTRINPNSVVMRNRVPHCGFCGGPTYLDDPTERVDISAELKNMPPAKRGRPSRHHQ